MTGLAAPSVTLALMGLQVLFASATPMPAVQSIRWSACPQNASSAMSCGTLDVPLDYTALEFNKRLPLQLVKVCIRRSDRSCLVT
jgi:hypothetical protein